MLILSPSLKEPIICVSHGINLLLFYSLEFFLGYKQPFYLYFFVYILLAGQCRMVVSAKESLFQSLQQFLAACFFLLRCNYPPEMYLWPMSFFLLPFSLLGNNHLFHCGFMHDWLLPGYCHLTPLYIIHAILPICYNLHLAFAFSSIFISDYFYIYFFLISHFLHFYTIFFFFTIFLILSFFSSSSFSCSHPLSLLILILFIGASFIAVIFAHSFFFLSFTPFFSYLHLLTVFILFHSVPAL